MQSGKRSFNLFDSNKDQVNEKLQKLLSHVALGEFEAADNIHKTSPDLLIMRGSISHPNLCYTSFDKKPLLSPVPIPFDQNPGCYRFVNRSAWQIALMNEEYLEAWFMKMCLVNFMGKEAAHDELKKQFDEIFPDGEIKKIGFDLEHGKQLLNNVWNAIVEDNSIDWNNYAQEYVANKNTNAALHALYTYAKVDCQTGIVFNANLYIEALKKFHQEHLNLSKASFWCVRVEEWLAACLGTRYLRTHSQGGLINSHRKGCILRDGSSYFAFRRNLLDYPGATGTVDFGNYYSQLRRQNAGYFVRGQLKEFETEVIEPYLTLAEANQKIAQNLCNAMKNNNIQNVQKRPRK